MFIDVICLSFCYVLLFYFHPSSHFVLLACRLRGSNAFCVSRLVDRVDTLSCIMPPFQGLPHWLRCAAEVGTASCRAIASVTLSFSIYGEFYPATVASLFFQSSYAAL